MLYIQGLQFLVGTKRQGKRPHRAYGKPCLLKSHFIVNKFSRIIVQNTSFIMFISRKSSIVNLADKYSTIQ